MNDETRHSDHDRMARIKQRLFHLRVEWASCNDELIQQGQQKLMLPVSLLAILSDPYQKLAVIPINKAMAKT